LNNDDDLIFNFTIVVRQDATRSSALDSLDTVINGLTFIFAATSRDLDNLITKGLHADPNLHKNNPNVQLVGDYSTSGSQSVQFQWIWKWKPPRQSEERVREWRNYCSVGAR
jgi:Arf-GAP/SH3 domain/ANK repeat/PH domain-containing protein